MKHLDEDYICKKFIKGHGGGYECSSYDKPLHILFICNKNKLQIFIYNIILYIRFYWRKYVKNKSR